MQSLSFYIKNPWSILAGFAFHFPFLFSDKLYLQLLSRPLTGYKLDIDNPKSFCEKIQWLKLHDHDKSYLKMTDKILVKDYVSNIIGDKYIIPTYQVWDTVDEIDISKLPERFVLKTSNGGGNNGVIVCNDKSKFNYEVARKILQSSLNADIYKTHLEWAYKDIEPKILAEAFIENENGNDLVDYKFFCFNGEPKYIQVIQDRNTVETIDFFDAGWNHQEFVGLNPSVRNSTEPLCKPANLDEMLLIARKLSAGKRFLRIDLYNVNGMVYFGEITFYPASGMGKFTPKIWDRKLGDMIDLQ